MNMIRALLSISLCLGLYSCVAIDGGAIEVRWDLQYGGESCPVDSSDKICVKGNRISCSLSGIKSIKLQIKPQFGGSYPCDDHPDACTFSCDEKVGTTRFFIPQGEYSITLLPISEAGNEMGINDEITTPAPIVRQIRIGELTNLNVNLIIVGHCLGC